MQPDQPEELDPVRERDKLITVLRWKNEHLRAELEYRREAQARTELRARRARRITRWFLAVLIMCYSLAGFVDQPCARESSHWCTWYADRQGNGQGQSFLDIGGWRTSSWFLITRPHR